MRAERLLSRPDFSAGPLKRRFPVPQYAHYKPLARSRQDTPLGESMRAILFPRSSRREPIKNHFGHVRDSTLPLRAARKGVEDSRTIFF